MKNKEITQRINVLHQLIERKQLEEEEPIDPFSRSLYEFFKEMAELDKDGIVAFHEQSVDDDGKPIGTLEGTREFVKTWAQEYERAKKDGVYRRLGIETDSLP